MAITPSSVTVGTNSGITATVTVVTSESPTATQVGDLVVVFQSNDFYAIANMITPTATGSPTLNAIAGATADGGASASHVKAYWYLANTGGAQTISATHTGTHDEDKTLVAWVLPAAQVNTSTPVGASGATGTVNAVSATAQVLSGATAVVSGAILLGHLHSSNSASTASYTTGTMTEAGEWHVFTSGVYASEQLASSGATGSRTITAASSTPWVGSLVIIEPSGAAASIPYSPQRSIIVRDWLEGPYVQRDRRDANLVGSAVDTLPAPLDVAYGAGGAQWHQRGGAADAATRTWQAQQRVYIDPAALAATNADPLLVGPGVGGDEWRRYNTPAYADRREVPQQRLYVSDPLLLDTAQLEGNLLGGAETAVRVATPATNAPRWSMPQQPRRDAMTPGLLDSALLEAPLATGDQRRRDHAAIYTDRREIPQQRAYISDPSTYPTAAATDPLPLAFGAGGTYWLLYNAPAVLVDRREVPQQRLYISDPAVLATALLEAPLLTGARPVVFTDRRSTVPQRSNLDPSLLGSAATDPLTLATGVGGDTWRRANITAYYDRQQTAAQPPRRTLYFDAGPGVPPLTLSWGAGGNLWHLYSPRRPSVWWRTPATYPIPADHVCVIARPNTGTTARGSTGTITRPFTGIVINEC